MSERQITKILETVSISNNVYIRIESDVINKNDDKQKINDH